MRYDGTTRNELIDSTTPSDSELEISDTLELKSATLTMTTPTTTTATTTVTTTTTRRTTTEDNVRKVKHFIFVEQAFVDNIDISLGKHTDINCMTSSDDSKYELSWHRGNLNEPSKFNSDSLNTHDGVLRIRNFKPEDAGYYTCLMTKANGELNEVVVILKERKSK